LDYYNEFRIEPHAKIKLKSVDPDFHGKSLSHQESLSELEAEVEQMDQQQYLLYAERKRAILIILQGLDASGKDGVVRHVIRGMNPAGCQVVGFKQPTSVELQHDFLWRVHPHAPGKGMVAIFNRSHYEDVLIPRVHSSVPEVVWSRRYALINDFENLLVTENDTTILKFYLHISKQEQLERFKHRLDDKNHQWKISESDYTERKFWDDYIDAFEDVFHKTSTKHAPWFVIPSNHKWFRNLAVSKIINTAMAGMKMKRPDATVDLDEIRRKYHKAACEGRSD